MKRFHKTLRWFIFTVLIALLPLLSLFLKLLTVSGTLPSLKVLCARGELLLIAVGITATAVGEMFASGTKKHSTSKIIAGGGCIIALLVACIWFSDISSTIGSGGTVNVDVVFYGSLLLYCFSFIASAGAIILSET